MNFSFYDGEDSMNTHEVTVDQSVLDLSTKTHFEGKVYPDAVASPILMPPPVTIPKNNTGVVRVPRNDNFHENESVSKNPSVSNHTRRGALKLILKLHLTSLV